MTLVDPPLLARTLSPLELTGESLRSFADAIGAPTDACVRLHPAVCAEGLPFASDPVPWHARGRWVRRADRPGARVAFAAADYYVQDAGSLLVPTLAGVRPGEFVCDLCAAPGGKATAALEDLAGEGWLLANETVHSRHPPLRFNLARHGAANFLVSRLDPESLAADRIARFDVVLVDAPCSGQSLVGRGKQSLSAFEPATIEHCARRERRILEAAADLVRPGGRLVYATCTFSHDENEGLVGAFLADHREWRPSPVAELAPWRVPEYEACYRLWPHRDRCAGAFASRIEREPDSAAPVDGPIEAEPRSARGARRLRWASAPREAVEWGEPAESGGLWIAENDRVVWWPRRPPDWMLAVMHDGPEFAFRKQTTWFPSYALAMRRDRSWIPARRAELDLSAAERYVMGEPIRSADRGWAVAVTGGRALGWLKGDGRLARNHLPKPGRFVPSS
ncbi:MAG: hypothetical protein FJ297_13620 [Planctomycetes bacterium]|nr:hypothetical protein [Planctomycetota bacterium]